MGQHPPAIRQYEQFKSININIKIRTITTILINNERDHETTAGWVKTD